MGPSEKIEVEVRNINLGFNGEPHPYPLTAALESKPLTTVISDFAKTYFNDIIFAVMSTACLIATPIEFAIGAAVGVAGALLAPRFAFTVSDFLSKHVVTYIPNSDVKMFIDKQLYKVAKFLDSAFSGEKAEDSETIYQGFATVGSVLCRGTLFGLFAGVQAGSLATRHITALFTGSNNEANVAYKQD